MKVTVSDTTWRVLMAAWNELVGVQEGLRLLDDRFTSRELAEALEEITELPLAVPTTPDRLAAVPANLFQLPRHPSRT